MNDKMNDLNEAELIAAYADGELSDEQNLEVMKKLAADPQSARRIMHQHQLKQAIGKAMEDPQLKTPDDVRAQIAVMAQTLPSTMPEKVITDEYARSPGVIARIGRWTPLAVAAVLFIGAATLYVQSQQVTRTNYTADVMTASLVERFRTRHMECCNNPDKMMQQFQSPTDIESLPGAMEDYFGTPFEQTPPLDLTIMGYEFAKAGNCLIPGMNAVHMIYKPKPDSNYQGSLSLWVRPNDGSLDLTEGVLYTARGTDETRPLLMWQSEGVVYYLIGDSMPSVRQAANILTKYHG